LQVPKSCTDLNPTLLYISRPGTYSKFVRKNEMLALGVCLPQQCPALAAGLPRQDHVWITTNNLFRYHNNEFDEMCCKVDSTEFARSIQTKPNPALINLSNLQKQRSQWRQHPLPQVTNIKGHPPSGPRALPSPYSDKTSNPAYHPHHTAVPTTLHFFCALIFCTIIGVTRLTRSTGTRDQTWVRGDQYDF